MRPVAKGCRRLRSPVCPAGRQPAQLSMTGASHCPGRGTIACAGVPRLPRASTGRVTKPPPVAANRPPPRARHPWAARGTGEPPSVPRRPSRPRPGVRATCGACAAWPPSQACLGLY
eukprot:4626134-Alexandrium_andersonii.AAC.1